MRVLWTGTEHFLASNPENNEHARSDMALQNQLKTLEQDLQQLLAIVSQLMVDKNKLVEREQALLAECERLQHKNRLAKEQIEEILTALRRPAITNSTED